MAITFESETLVRTLGAMRDEAAREMNRSDARPESKRAWYYSQVGAYELAQQMGWITDAERRQLVQELNDMTSNEGRA